MRRYLKINISKGEVVETFQWNDNRDFPDNIIIEDGFEIHEVDPEIQDVDIYYTSDLKGNYFILDVSDNDLELTSLKQELAEYEVILSDFQEATWIAMGIDTTKLPQEWQDRLAYKNNLREQIAILETQLVI
ncbi:hypothetical protein [Candidatus Clostridium stratigraminis]|uniref:Phage protein n=1 Tax=Candidatus Clostridium stratigraminis TaxID=3381661 RepID=A0ABW8T0U6_9CLOT